MADDRQPISLLKDRVASGDDGFPGPDRCQPGKQEETGTERGAGGNGINIEEAELLLQAF